MTRKTLDLNQLLDKAKEVTGSDYATAKLLGIAPQLIYDWRALRKNPQPEDATLIAAIAGLDPVAELARTMVQKHEGTPKGDKLMQALGKSLLLTGAAIGSVSANARTIFSIENVTNAVSYLMQFVLLLNRKRRVST